MLPKRTCFTLVVLVLLTSLHSAAQAPAEQPAPIPAAKSISADAIRAHIRFLSGSLLEGRQPGTRGYDIAAEYVATEMISTGLQPAGDNDTWFQQITFRKSVNDPAASSFVLLAKGGKTRFQEGEDYIISSDLARESADFEAPLVFVGYGVTAPELNYDDYAGVDVRGKIVVFLAGAPPSFPSSQRAHYSDSATKAQIAIKHGAIARVRIAMPEEETGFPWTTYVNHFRGGSLGWVRPDMAPSQSFPELKATVSLSPSGREKLFKTAPKSLDKVFQDANQSRTQSFQFPLRAYISFRAKHSTITSPNVIGLLRGSDPALRDEYVVYTAHLDHMGICRPVQGDNICHGAWDNASGVAAMLEVARTYTRVPQPPRRSILFLAVTAEESGLLGADYFAHFPTVPRDAIVANINMDGAPGLLGATRTLTAFGAEHSSLGANAKQAANLLGFELTPDPMPQEMIFVRSDQYPFVRQGIPALFLTDGKDGLETLSKWLVTKYHTPLDRIDHPFDYQATARAAGVSFLIGYDVAREQKRPTWNPGDFFGETFGRKRAAAAAGK